MDFKWTLKQYCVLTWDGLNLNSFNMVKTLDYRYCPYLLQGNLGGGREGIGIQTF